MPAPDSIDRFREATNEMDRVYNLIARASGVSPTEFWVLIYADEGTTSQSAIAHVLGASRQTVNSACAGLVRRGLVTLADDPDNRRLKRVELTDAGRDFAARYVRPMEQAEESFWNRIPADQRVLLSDLLEQFAASLEQDWHDRAHPE